MTQSALGYPLHEDEKILLELKPNPKVIWPWMCTKVWHILLIIFVICFWTLPSFLDIHNRGTSSYNAVTRLPHYGLAIIFIILIITYFWLKLVSKAYDYIITDQRCFIRYGLISLNTRIIPISQINDVNIIANFALRLFSLENVYIDTISTAYLTTRSRTMNNSSLLEGLSKEQSLQAVTVLTNLMRQKKTQ